MKKVFLTVFIVIICVSITTMLSLVGCKTEEKEANVVEDVEETEDVAEVEETEEEDIATPVTIKLLHQLDDPQTAKFEEIVANFEAENPNIKLELERNNEANYYEKLVTTIIGEDAPDIARIEYPKAAQYIAAGYIANLDSYISADFFDGFFESTFLPVLKDGSHYGIPQSIDALVLFYRTDMFEEAGIASPPATWDELITVAQQLTKKPDVYGIGLFGGWGPFEFYPWFFQAGAEMFEEQDGKLIPAFNSDAGVEALQLWVDLIHKYEVMPEGSSTYTEDDVKGGFLAKSIAMFTSGPWTITSMKANTDMDGKWAIAPLPEGKEKATVLGGLDFLVMEQSQYKEEAVKFLTYFYQDDIQLDWAKSFNLIPIKKSSYQDSFFSEDPIMQVFSEQLEVTKPIPTIPEMAEISDLFGKAIQSAMIGEKSPEEALNEAAQMAEDILER